jgi:formylmethanofuran dehydrogenase subunit C
MTSPAERHARPSPGRSARITCEGDVAGEQGGFLVGGEVSAAGHAGEVVGAFGGRVVVGRGRGGRQAADREEQKAD